MDEEKKDNRGGKRENSGRKKGTPNKISGQVRQNVIDVFDDIGGVKEMAVWAVDNRTEFYRLYAKLMPTQSEIGTMDGHDSPLNVTLKFVKPNNDGSDSE